jgi:hypothetical protein
MRPNSAHLVTVCSWILRPAAASCFVSIPRLAAGHSANAACIPGRIGNPFWREAGVVPTAARGLAKAISLLVEEVGDVGVDVAVEELVDQFDDAGLYVNLLGGGFWARGGERLDLAALEAHVNFGGSFCWQLDEGDVPR